MKKNLGTLRKNKRGDLIVPDSVPLSEIIDIVNKHFRKTPYADIAFKEPYGMDNVLVIGVQPIDGFGKHESNYGKRIYGFVSLYEVIRQVSQALPNHDHSKVKLFWFYGELGVVAEK